MKSNYVAGCRLKLNQTFLPSNDTLEWSINCSHNIWSIVFDSRQTFDLNANS